MRKIRTLVYGFRYVSKFIDNLEEKGLIDVVLEYQSLRKKSISYYDLQYCAPEKTYSYKYTMPYEFYKELFYEHFPAFLSNISRFDGSYAKYNDAMQVYYMFKRVADYCYNALLENEVELYIHTDIPHEIHDTTFAYIAEKLGIKTIYAMGVPYIKTRIFMLKEDFRNFGLFENERKHYSSTDEDLKDFLQVKKVLESKADIYCFDNIINDLALNEQNYFKLSNIKRKTEFENILNKVCINELPKGLKYVYFPLHYQPEASTITFGEPHFEDQSVLIEYILRLLPKDYYIVVKEHFLQTYNHRDPVFYQKLTELKKVIFAHPKMDSKEILKNSKFAITTSGTVGFEALLTGKPIVFSGHALYRKITGAFKFDENFNINEVLSYKFNEEKTRQDLKNYLDTGYRGNIVPRDLTQSEQEENIKNIEYAYDNYINEIFEKDPNYFNTIKEKYKQIKKQSLIPDIIDKELQKKYSKYLPDLSYFNNKEYEANFLKPKEKKKTVGEKTLIFLEKNTRSLRKLFNKIKPSEPND